MTTARSCFSATVVGLLLAGAALAQGRPQTDEAFLNRPPKVGDPIPDLEAYDAEGKPFRLSQLKGNYTVLVFGCLT